MLDDIRGDLRIKPKVSVALAFCMILTFLLILLEPNFQKLIGVVDSNGVNFKARLSVPFVHGYDQVTSIVHLSINLILMYLLGTYIEKIIGGFRFLLITGIFCIIYVLTHRLMLMIGHGFTPVIMMYSSLSFIILNEARYVKTSSTHDDYYRVLWITNIFIWICTPIILNIIPIYFDNQTSSAAAIVNTNLLLFEGLVLGIVAGLIIKKQIRNKLVQYTRKKYIKHDKIDEISWIGVAVVPIIIFWSILL